MTFKKFLENFKRKKWKKRANQERGTQDMFDPENRTYDSRNEQDREDARKKFEEIKKKLKEL